MAYFTKAMLEENIYEAKRYEEMLVAKTLSDAESFHVFLSHSYKDKMYIRKLKDYIENTFKLKCYVDWITEPKALDRSKVNSMSAALLRKRMRQSQSLIFCTSDNSPDSKWMPWELGYFDAHKGRVAVLPILDEGTSFHGQEYLGLYPYIDKTDNIIWINDGQGGYVSLTDWLNGVNPYKRS